MINYLKNLTILHDIIEDSYNNEQGLTNAFALLRGIFNKLLPKSKRIDWKKFESITERDLMHTHRLDYFRKQIESSDKSVIDLGCGKRLIENFLPPNCRYIPVDYKNRGDGTVICDFNNYEYPNIVADVVLMISVLQWVEDPLWLIAKACQHCNKKILFHYIAPYDENDIFIKLKREGEGIKNHLSPSKILCEFNSNGFKLSDKSKISIKNNRYELFLFSNLFILYNKVSTHVSYSRMEAYGTT